MKIISIIIGIIMLGMAGTIGFLLPDNQETSVGSTPVGSSYAWTATSSPGTTQLITNNPVVLGSVVISTDSAGTFVVKNATSTDDTGVIVASFEATQGEGTYTFDTYLDKGLQIVGGASGDGLITVTYRQQ